MTADPTAGTKHFRRGPSTVRELVLNAAHELFTTQGYHGTKTRQIAELAGVGEPVIFRNFGTKAELFETAILKPFADFLDDWTASWDRTSASSSDPALMTAKFVKGFYALVAEHRELLRTLIAARVQGGDTVLAQVAAAVSDKLAQALLMMRRTVQEQTTAHDYRDVDPAVSTAIAAGSVLSMVLLDDWLFPSNERPPSKARQINELQQMLMHGVAHRD